ncbi:sensor histidine kinase [Georgenia sp. 311]|uniref:sensor histidine kinase n=1 Tax=Georgenia sp. 311 TaxID=2585134 RepID=UPI001111F871|nr:histidine kinase [Georgenia sp. 311]TNC18640.1 sensor histidine kinase [Georgenia sp. 311]
MVRMMELWRRRTAPQRMETYTRWTLYVLLALLPFMALVLLGATEPEERSPLGLIVFVGMFAAQTAAGVVVLRDGVTAYRDNAALPRRPLTVFLVLTAAAVAACLMLVPAEDDFGWAGRGGALVLVLACALWALAPVLTSVALLPASALAGVLAALANRPAMTWTGVAISMVSFGIVLVTISLSFRISVWMMGVVWEQERTRQLHARLAVAEERLRFSRDLHDVLGRALSAMALKSELGAELSRRGQGERAAEQMLEVRELANESLREVRAVVAGYRQADLPTELAGARSMLRSAGVRTRVIGEDTVLPPGAQSALGWVVREGATNVVRHSSAGTCTIDLAIVEEGVAPAAQLTMTNDGVSGPPSAGSGLLGLSERLARLGGSLTTGVSGDTFTLRARVPLDTADLTEGS